MYYTDNPVSDWIRYCDETEAAYKRDNAKICCCGCGKPIGRKTRYHLSDLNGGEDWCPECARQAVKDIYIDDVYKKYGSIISEAAEDEKEDLINFLIDEHLSDCEVE